MEFPCANQQLWNRATSTKSWVCATRVAQYNPTEPPQDEGHFLVHQREADSRDPPRNFHSAGRGNTAIASGGSGGTHSGGFKDRLVKYCSGMPAGRVVRASGRGMADIRSHPTAYFSHVSLIGLE